MPSVTGCAGCWWGPTASEAAPGARQRPRYHPWIEEQTALSSVPTDRKARALTGYRPTGPLHVGHWFGNVRNMLDLQAEHDAFFFIADWHALTTDFDRTEELPERVRGLVLDWLAAGIDPEKATLYRQSDIAEVAEMTLLLGMITPLGWLERVPSFKERLRDLSDRDIANLGLLGYPVLMAVDICIVRAEVVPVGEDQLPHLELSREIVRRFNRLYGDVLVEPKALLSESPNIPGSDGRKMSKSLGNEIGVRFSADEIQKKVRTFITDPTKLRKGDPGRPEVCPVFALHKEFSHDILEQTEADCRSGALGCVDCKANLSQRISDYFAPFRDRRAGLETTAGLVNDVLDAGAEKALPVIRETMTEVRKAMNLDR